MSDSGLFWPSGNFYDLRLYEQFLLDWCVLCLLLGLCHSVLFFPFSLLLYVFWIWLCYVVVTCFLKFLGIFISVFV